MKRRMLALVLALGMLLASTLSVSAAGPVALKVAPGPQEALALDPEVQKWEDEHIAYLFNKMTYGFDEENFAISNCHLGFPIYVH